MRLSLVFALAASAALFACGGVSSTQCTKGTSSCVNDNVARLCADDGIPVDQTCADDQICMTGSCVARTDVACQPSDSKCSDSGHALVCNANGMGYTSTACPANTTCGGDGVCIGTCVVGSSRCNGDMTVETCTDGFTWQQANCALGTTSCVNTTGFGARLETAACKPATCNPGSGAVCGDKATDANNVDPSFVSFCGGTPEGVRWITEQCAVNSTCVPGQGCEPDCIPGEHRCSNTNGIQTCNAQGGWDAPTTQCIPTATGAAQVCQYPPPSYSEPVCGDELCAEGYAGACEADGYHACVNGKVAEAAQACLVGVCAAQSGGTVGGFTPGQCQTECTPGDSKCDGLGQAVQTCDNKGRWSATATQCTGTGNSCISYTDSVVGRPRAVCGTCQPGRHRCTDGAGTPTGSTGPDVEVCGVTGNPPVSAWQAASACSVGQCQSNFAGDFGCVAQCQPNSTVCVGAAPASPTDPLHPGTVNFGTCTASGTIPTSSTACPTSTSCRMGLSGVAINNNVAGSPGVGTPCVTCVGPNISGGNEYGLVDSYCTSGTQREVCQANNTWTSPATCSTTAPASGACAQESPYHNTQVCGGPPYYEGSYCSSAFLIANGYPTGCAAFGTGSSAFGPWGGVSDCCSNVYCQTYSGSTSFSPTPATCQ